MKTEIEQRFETEARSLSGLRERFNAQVVRWVYSLFEIWSYEDRRLKGSDTDILHGPEGAFHACGYDASDQPIVLLQYDTETVYGRPGTTEPAFRKIPTQSVWCEAYVRHDGDTLDVTRIVRGQLDRVSRLRFLQHRLLEDESVIQGFYQHTLLHYQGTKTRLQQSLNNKGQVFYEIDFGPHGEQSHFRVRRDGTRFQLYQPLPKGVTVKSLKEIVQERLVALIPELVSAATICEPIYCVALVYDDEGNDALPPSVAIGLESERRHWKAQHGKRAKDFVWNPAEFHHYEKSHTQLSDEALEEACDHLNSKWMEGNPAGPASKLLIETAAELNRLDWPSSVLRTEDFVVYAVGVEGSGLRKSLKASLGTERLATLKSANLI